MAYFIYCIKLISISMKINSKEKGLKQRSALQFKCSFYFFLFPIKHLG